jgi:uncharacterized protein YcfL
LTAEMSKLYENQSKDIGIHYEFDWFDFVHLDITEQIKKIPEELFRNVELNEEEEDYINIGPMQVKDIK